MELFVVIAVIDLTRISNGCMERYIKKLTKDPFFIQKVQLFDLTLKVTSNSTLKLTCNQQRLRCVSFLIDWLIYQDEVLWLEPQPLMYASLQTAVASVYQAREPFINVEKYRSTTSFGFLTGKGQIVGIADTGVDLTSCFFVDSVPVGPTHRKVLRYIPYADSSDIYQGHGTAVAGAFVGNCRANASTAMYDGVVPDAKIVIFDISNTTAGRVIDFAAIDQPLTMPDDINDMFTLMYGAGVRVMVDSWGSGPLSEPSKMTQQLDEFVWYHRDFLDVRSAGNDGKSYFSISTQAVAKNVISVGALDTTFDQYLRTIDFADLTSEIDKVKSQYCLLNDLICNLTTDQECCSVGLSIVQETCCRDNLRNEATRFRPSIIASFSSKGPTRDQRVKPDVLAIGNRVIVPMAPGATPFTSVTPNPDCSMEGNLFTLAGTSFSASIVAGAATIVRQYFTDGWYPTGVADSRNIKIPSAALIKAMLITAADPISSYIDGDGNEQPVSSSVLPYASFEGGFGKVALERVLYFDQTSNFSLFILEGDSVTNETDSYCFELPSETCHSGQSFSTIMVTLVWTDYPAFPGAVRQLVNDLDLVVIQSNQRGKEKVSYGNGLYDTITEEETPDRLNNVERIIVNVTHCPMTLRINVTGYDVPATCDTRNRNCLPQAFHVVVRGPIGLQQASNCVECKSDDDAISCAIDNGTGEKRCKNGRYTECFVSDCDEGYTMNAYGNDCRAFLSFYVVIGISSGAFVILTALICIPISFIHQTTPPGGSVHHGVDFWDVFQVIKPRLSTIVLGSVFSLVGTSCSLIQYVISIVQF